MDKKAIAFSLLAQINNQIGKYSNFDQVFLPLVKRALSKMCANGKYKGDDLDEIRQNFKVLYGIDMPISVLQMLLGKIEKELNTYKKKYVTFYSDGSFIIDKYIFDDFEEEIEKRTENLNQLQNMFDEFVKTTGSDVRTNSIFEFIEENKVSIGKYIGKKAPMEFHDNTIEARFIAFIRSVTPLYEVVQSVYIGSIISAYLEYQPVIKTKSIELVLDTNFIISLIDLNTPNSTSNCRRLLEIAKKIGYRFTVLGLTLKELSQLIKTKVDYFDTAFLAKQLDPEDIYNACERRGLSKTDLDRIQFNIADEISKYEVFIIHDTTKYENKAKYSEDFERLKGIRNTEFAALHDATCIEYVKEKRTKPIYDYDRVNCWFINNSSSKGVYNFNGWQPYQIKAEDLLNLLWLTTPGVKQSLSLIEMSSIGLSRLVSTTLDNSLPSAKMIRELDENVQKYARDKVTDEEVIRVSKAIAERTVIDVEKLNDQAKRNKVEFVARLHQIANKQNEKEEELKSLFNKIFTEVSQKAKEFNEQVADLRRKEIYLDESMKSEKDKYRELVDVNSGLLEQNLRVQKENIELENCMRRPLREKFIKKKIRWWQFRGCLPFIGSVLLIISSVLYLLAMNNWNYNKTKEAFSTYSGNIIFAALLFVVGVIFSSIFTKILSDRFNSSSINAFKLTLIIPEELKELQFKG